MSTVARKKSDKYVHGDPFKERIAEHFRKSADLVDALVAKVFALEEESQNTKTKENSISRHYSKMMQDHAEAKVRSKACSDAMDLACLDAQAQTAAYRVTIQAKIRELENQAVENKRARDKAVDEKIASIPSESTVNEWAQSATKDYLEKPDKLDEITIVGATATSSITA